MNVSDESIVNDALPEIVLTYAYVFSDASGPLRNVTSEYTLVLFCGAM